eukprot:INCI1873.1.p1 GENE.INCI1873.1~~INCI1873.1.p1  ORF type:complete len:742 (+),score=142.04 INCI1873.1:49-2226(+)
MAETSSAEQAVKQGDATFSTPALASDVSSSSTTPTESSQTDVVVHSEHKGPRQVGALVPSKSRLGTNPRCQQQQQRPSKEQLARLEDPTDFHVMPSSFSAAARLAKSSGSMPPPSGAGSVRVMPRQKILDEDEFADGIGTIVQRDFFPDLPKLKAQLDYLEASERGDSDRMQEISSMYTRSLRRKLNGDGEATPTPFSVAAGATPTQTSCGRSASNQEADLQDNNSGEDDDEDPATHPGGLDSWLATRNGEDNASFEEILEKDKAAHRAKHWWVWNDGAKAGQGFRMLTDGTIVRVAGNPGTAQLALQDATGRADAGISADSKLARITQGGESAVPAAVAHKLSSGVGMGAGGWKGDDRKGNLDMVPYRNRNHLMFQPELAVSREICGLPSDGNNANNSDSAAAIVNYRKDKHGNHIYKAPKEIKHNNTRFEGDPDSYNEAAAVVAVVADEERRKLAAQSGGTHQVDGGVYDYVSTPKIIPGETIAPLMTWGAVEGTPLILRDAASMTPIDLRDTSHNDFKIRSAGAREQVALRLESEARERQKRKRDRTASMRRRPTPGSSTPGAATPYGSASSHSSSSSSSSSRSSKKKARRHIAAQPTLLTPAQRRLSMMSPAARSMAARLARGNLSARKSPFGGSSILDSQLRASYAGIGAGSASRRVSSLARRAGGSSAAPTPQMSPARAILAGRSSSKKASRRGTPSHGSRSSRSGTSTNPITDNLLKL